MESIFEGFSVYYLKGLSMVTGGLAYLSFFLLTTIKHKDRMCLLSRFDPYLDGECSVLNEYDYFVYVDASGDDGFKFEKGSSSCYVASCLIVHKSDVQHNIDILSKIKFIMGAKPGDEVKSTRLRRHPRRNKIYELLPDVRGALYSMVAFKKMLNDERMLDTKSKYLTSLCHTFPLVSMQKHFVSDSESKILVVIDRMKKVEMDAVEVTVSHFFSKEMYDGDYELIFRDSKDPRYEMLQLADIFAGISREYFELYETDNTVKQLRNKCGLCSKMYNKCLCKPRDRRITHIPFQKIKPLYSNNPTGLVVASFMTIPKECLDTYSFLWCMKK